jgi:hypothetical protein
MDAGHLIATLFYDRIENEQDLNSSGEDKCLILTMEMHHYMHQSKIA